MGACLSWPASILFVSVCVSTVCSYSKKKKKNSTDITMIKAWLNTCMYPFNVLSDRHQRLRDAQGEWETSGREVETGQSIFVITHESSVTAHSWSASVKNTLTLLLLLLRSSTTLLLVPLPTFKSCLPVLLLSHTVWLCVCVLVRSKATWFSKRQRKEVKLQWSHPDQLKRFASSWTTTQWHVVQVRLIPTTALSVPLCC